MLSWFLLDPFRKSYILMFPSYIPPVERWRGECHKLSFGGFKTEGKSQLDLRERGLCEIRTQKSIPVTVTKSLNKSWNSARSEIKRPLRWNLKNTNAIYQNEKYIWKTASSRDRRKAISHENLQRVVYFQTCNPIHNGLEQWEELPKIWRKI